MEKKLSLGNNVFKSTFSILLCVLCFSLNAQTDDNDTIIEEEKIYTTVALTKVPEYPGGVNAFYKYISKNFNVPAEVEQDLNVRVLTTFVIEKDGTITNIKVIKDPGFGLAYEAKRILAAIPEKWSPGIMDGEPVRVSYSLPIHVDFKAPKLKKKQE